MPPNTQVKDEDVSSSPESLLHPQGTTQPSSKENAVLVSITVCEFCLFLNFISMKSFSIYSLSYFNHEILHENMDFFSLENHRPDNLGPSLLQGVDNLGLNYCALPAINPITPTPGWTSTLFRLAGDTRVGNSRCKLVSLPHLPRGIIVCTLEKHI